MCVVVSKIADKVEVISSGSLSLDLALGVGGLPKGYVHHYKALIATFLVQYAQPVPHLWQSRGGDLRT